MKAVPGIVEVTSTPYKVFSFNLYPANPVPSNPCASPSSMGRTVAFDISIADCQKIRASLNWQEAHDVSSEGVLVNLAQCVNDVALTTRHDCNPVDMELKERTVVARASLKVSDPSIASIGLELQHVALSESADPWQRNLHRVWGFARQSWQFNSKHGSAVLLGLTSAAAKG
ncbi:hypothetical protein [Derxia lacustris]|uniref:hypothetical protein n=1 Tax=Derxia lacustris TaxID=764842 RepID=UPI00111C6A3B|nr:hypothetical protein [Derxia lacustris]